MRTLCSKLHVLNAENKYNLKLFTKFVFIFLLPTKYIIMDFFDFGFIY